MKTLITSNDQTLSSTMDKRLGRAHWFCIYDEELKESTFQINPNIDSMGGAGTKTAELIIELGVKKVISGHFGPKAKEMLEKFDIQMIEVDDDNITIEELISRLNQHSN
ncbi:MAG: dinitrogenase iron-molybdenum cofactor biosynthesis protein [Prolixibacteraceae bacterium]|jgi:predicted Fe-Mo cluster-binding NifX family protein|nr:dinitrogenase iron-molybdenum cofactor biosynthesis protein [Prolixibacteraceae bacterium]